MANTNKKMVSSFTADLFGAKESPPSSIESFFSIFPPPTTVSGRNSTSSDITGTSQKQALRSQSWSTKLENAAKNGEDFNKDRKSVFQERVIPCPLSSSIYYGSQEDMYVRSSSAQTSGSYPTFGKDGKDDDPNGNNLHSASRGNWWQGSLYY